MMPPMPIGILDSLSCTLMGDNNLVISITSSFYGTNNLKKLINLFNKTSINLQIINLLIDFTKSYKELVTSRSN